jgi:hypothetical protein
MASGMINPVFDTEADRIKEQLAQADALRKVGMEGNTGSGYHGGRVFIVGNPLANIASGVAGAYMGNKALNQQQALQDTREQEFKSAMDAMPGMTTKQSYDPVSNPGTGPLMNMDVPKPYEQVMDERQKWGAGLSNIKHPLAQAIAQNAMVAGINAPEKLLEKEMALKLAREKMAEEASRRASDDEWKRYVGQMGISQRQQGIDIQQEKADDIARQAKEKADLKAEEAAKAASARTQMAQEGIDNIDRMIGKQDANGQLLPDSAPHPGFSGYVGATLLPGLRFIEGTDVAGYETLHKQVKGAARLVGVKMMKGTGSVSNAEGAAAADALTSMDKAQSEQEYVAAALRYRNIMQAAIDRERRGVTIHPDAPLGGNSAKYERPRAAEVAPAPAAPAAAPGKDGPRTVKRIVQLKDGSTGIEWSNGDRTRQ